MVSEMITLYYIKNKETPSDVVRPVEPLLFEDKSEIERWMKQLTNGFQTLWENARYEIGSFEITEKCQCEDYRQTTMILLDFADADNPRILGSDNFLGIYNKVGLPLGTDIESHTGGRYQLMSRHYFHKHYAITPRDKVVRALPEIVKMPENPCPFCKKNEVTQLCDFVVDYVSTTHPKHFGRMSLTCDNPICKECAKSFAGHDFCPSCAPLYEHVRENHKRMRSLRG